MNQYRHIEFRRNDGVVTIAINRPERLNALHPEAHAEMAAALDAYAHDASLQVAVITGTGDRAFCAGSDLKVRAQMGHDEMPLTGFAGITQRFDLDKPLIAAVNGDAVGGGLEIVLACDLALAVTSATFGLPEPKVGLAASGGLHRLARQLPAKWAMEIALTGRLFTAKQAAALGLINAVVEPHQLDAAISSLTAAMLECAPLALRATKQMMRQGLEQPSLQAAFAAHYDAYEAMLHSEDAIEGPLAFAHKRPPVWKGR